MSARTCAASRCGRGILRHEVTCEPHWLQLPVRTRMSVTMTPGLPDSRRQPWRRLLSEIRNELDATVAPPEGRGA